MRKLTKKINPKKIKSTGYFKKLGKKINKINHSKGWKVIKPEEWDSNEYKVPATIALITSELSEALEAYRKNDKENFIEEFADTIIRILGVSEGLKMDLEKAVYQKIEKNKKREYRHGGKKV